MRKWHGNSNGIKQFIVYLLSFSIGYSPSFSYGAANQKLDQTKAIKDFYKTTGYKGGDDIRTWLNKNPEKFHYKMRMMLERLQLANPEAKLPTIDFSEYQKDGKTYTRLVMKLGREQKIIDIYKNRDGYLAKIDGETLSYDDIYYDGVLTAGDLNPALTLEQLEQAYKTNPAAATFYQFQFREFMNAFSAESNLVTPEHKKEASYIDLILQIAYAGEKDGKCVIGGNLSMISTSKAPGYCGAEDPKKDSLIYCSGEKKGQFRCNPLVYGYDTNGNEFCVPRQNDKPAVYVSRACNEGYDLNNETSKKLFVAGILANKAKQGIKDQGDFFQKMKDYIKSASDGCGIKESEVETRIREKRLGSFQEKEFETAFPVRKPYDYNQGHRTACMYLMNRLILASNAADCAQSNVLLSEASTPQEREQAKKCYDGKPVVVVPVAPKENKCDSLKDRSELVRVEYEAKNISAEDAKAQMAKIQEEQKKIKDCDFVAWVVPTSPVPLKPLEKVDIQSRPVARVNASTPAKAGFSCGNSFGTKIMCGAGIVALACLVIGCGGKSKPKAQPVGKPGETQNTGTSTNRPAPAPGAR